MARPSIESLDEADRRGEYAPLPVLETTMILQEMAIPCEYTPDRILREDEASFCYACGEHTGGESLCGPCRDDLDQRYDLHEGDFGVDTHREVESVYA